MHRLSRFIVAGALLAGTVVFVSGSPASAAVPTTTCTGSNNAAVAFNNSGIVLESQKSVTFATASNTVGCSGPIVSSAHWSANFGGFFGNCNTLMGDVGHSSRFTITWDSPANLGYTQGFARAKVSSRTTTTTTLTFWGTLDDSAGHLYRGRAFTGTVVINTSLMTVPLGNCSITSPLTGGSASTTFKLY